MKDALDASILDGPVLVALYGVTAVIAAVLVAVGGRRRAPGRLLGLATGGVVGLVASWLLGDVMDVVGVAPTVPMRFWTAVLGAGLGLAVVVLLQGPVRQRLLTPVALVLVLASAGAGINVEFGQFPTLRALFGLTRIAPLTMPAPGTGSAALPRAGRVGAVTIPALVSGFPARPAVVYLPPIALLRSAPALPVLIMLSGQPGSPTDVFTAGRMASLLDAYANTHGGYAPIVVVPDQLSSPTVDPMCVDGPLGNSASYLTVDVPRWIRATLHVLPGRRAWSIGGYSQGGTCAIQLGGSRPDLFGTIVDVSGELVPAVGSVQATIDRGFGGNRAAYLAATPEEILRRNTPYADSTVLFAAGSADARYLPFERRLDAAARAAGMTSRLIVSPGTAHDWATVRYAVTRALPMLMVRAGLGSR